MQTRVSRGLSVTCSDSGVHEWSSHGCLFTAAEGYPGSGSFYTRDRHCFGPASRIHSNSPGSLLFPQSNFYLLFLVFFFVNSGNGVWLLQWRWESCVLGCVFLSFLILTKYLVSESPEPFPPLVLFNEPNN